MREVVQSSTETGYAVLVMCRFAIHVLIADVLLWCVIYHVSLVWLIRCAHQ